MMADVEPVDGGEDWSWKKLARAVEFGDGREAVLVAADLVATGATCDSILRLASLDPSATNGTAWRDHATDALRSRADAASARELGLGIAEEQSTRRSTSWAYLTLRLAGTRLEANGIAVPSSLATVDEALDAFGQEGWELVSVIVEEAEVVRSPDRSSWSRPIAWRYILKRPR